jgi:hypothetical protein
MGEHGPVDASTDWQPIFHTPLRIWLATAMIIVGFIVGGVGVAMQSALVASIGAAVVVVASIAAWALGIMRNVH